jgi:ribosome-associated protein
MSGFWRTRSQPTSQTFERPLRSVRLMAPSPSRSPSPSGSQALPAEQRGSLRVSRSLSIPSSELAWRFSRSSGPGGQHANTASTRAEVRFDIAGSRSLGPRQKARLLERLGPEVRVVAEDERSQARNRALALERLSERLASALRIEPTRLATAPSTSSSRRRLESKRRRGDIKRQRTEGRQRDDD